jgi:hypothetical protein
MKPTRSTRKPVDSLSRRDLGVFPIWEFATDEEARPGRDESWVRPVVSKAIPHGRYSLSVAADFVTASGQTLSGFVGVSTASGFEVEDGAVLQDELYLFVPRPQSRFRFASQAREALARALALSEAEVFPLRFELRVPLRGERAARSGEYP